MSKESSEVQKLFERIVNCRSLAVEFNDVAFRFVGVKYANEDDLLSGVGAGRYGRRWNPMKMDAIYASLSPETATKECYQEFAKYGFTESNIRPRVMVAIKIKVHNLLDLTDAKRRRGIGFSLKELVEEDWDAIQKTGEESWTQAIGRGCYVAGFEGLIVPSAADGKGKNIVIFPDKISESSSAVIIGKEELPIHPSV